MSKYPYSQILPQHCKMYDSKLFKVAMDAKMFTLLITTIITKEDQVVKNWSFFSCNAVKRVLAYDISHF